MQRQKLRTREIIPTLDIVGDLDRDVPVVLDHLGRTPFARGLVVDGLPDLEPAVSSGVVARDGGVYLFQVHRSGAFVRGIERSGIRVGWLLSELEREGG